jgi:hypothetical protein
LDINRAGLDQLRAHPYLNFYQVKVIVEQFVYIIGHRQSLLF